jgi:hypothetical protein
MTIQRMDSVLIVVDDLEAVEAFFADLSRKGRDWPQAWNTYRPA